MNELKMVNPGINFYILLLRKWIIRRKEGREVNKEKKIYFGILNSKAFLKRQPCRFFW